MALKGFMSSSLESGYKVAICPRGNLPYMRTYLITEQKLLWGAYRGFNNLLYNGFYLISVCFISGFQMALIFPDSSVLNLHC